MAQNPLLGSRISLISKKNIRYEGTLYSINETDATVALQGVRAYGTEGRETDADLFLPPQDTVHPYLLFRGCDIKDLHVHEQQSADDADDKSNLPSDPAIVSAERPKTEEEGANTETVTHSPKVASAASTAPPETAHNDSNDANDTNDKAAEVDVQANTKNEQSKTEKDSSHVGDDVTTGGGQSTKSHKVDNNRSSNNRRKKNHSSNGNGSNNNNNNNNNSNKPKQMVGSGASLLRRKARGVVDGENVGPKNPNEKNFDFESNLAEFTKSYDDENGDEPDSNDEDDNIGSYEKNDFFDSISCDVSDRQNGVDNRLRGKAERSLNTETFGATSLGYGRRNNRRYRGRGGGGRGRGRGGGGGGFSSGGSGGGRGRTHNRPRENNRWKEGNERHQSKSGRGGSRRTYGDGGLSANGAQ